MTTMSTMPTAGPRCPHCKKPMGMLAHGECEKCGKRCGCSFDPTSSDDYCRSHRPRYTKPTP